jgi:hypothetical protein
MSILGSIAGSIGTGLAKSVFNSVFSDDDKKQQAKPASSGGLLATPTATKTGYTTPDRFKPDLPSSRYKRSGTDSGRAGKGLQAADPVSREMMFWKAVFENARKDAS